MISPPKQESHPGMAPLRSPCRVLVARPLPTSDVIYLGSYVGPQKYISPPPSPLVYKPLEIVIW